LHHSPLLDSFASAHAGGKPRDRVEHGNIPRALEPQPVHYLDQRVVELDMIPGLRTYSVNAKAREPLVSFMTGALTGAGCRIIHSTLPDRAPFVIARSVLVRRIDSEIHLGAASWSSH
jgi:hypothetical protein